MTTGPSLRWFAKKAARSCVAVGGALAPARAQRPRVHVLTYHRFTDEPYDPFSVSPAVFEAQMRWLRDENLAVSLGEIEGFVAGRNPVRDGAVLVTIDDGEPSVFEHALPVLSAFEIPAVAFVPAGELTDASTPARSDRTSWDRLRDAQAAGLSVGSHAWTHRSLGGRPAAEVREEARRSRETLEQKLGRAVTAFAYPFGTRKDYGPTIGPILRECGYTCAFTSQHGPIVPGLDAFELPRIKIEGGDPRYVFQAACSGSLDAWRWIDRTLWRLQATPAPEQHGGPHAG